MIRMHTCPGSIARRITTVVGPTLVLLTGVASAHGTGGYGGMMGRGGGYGGLGLLGGGMLLWPLLLVGTALVLLYALARRTEPDGADAALSTLRERYARGEITAEEFADRRRSLTEGESS